MNGQLEIKETKDGKETLYVARIKLAVVRETTDTELLSVSSSADVATLPFVKDELLHSDREKFLCLHLNTKNAVMSYEVVSIGTLNSTSVHPREVFKAAILSNSAAIIVVHNHPSQNPTPSAEDISLSKRLAKAGNLLGIELLDHVIVCETSFVSLREKGLM